MKSNDIDIDAINKMKDQLDKNKTKVQEDVKDNLKLKQEIINLQNELKSKIQHYDDKLNYIDVQEKKIKHERLSMANRSSGEINSYKSEYMKDPNIEINHLKQALNLKAELINKLRDDMDTYYMNYKKENDGLRSINEELKRKLINMQVETEMAKSTHNEQSLEYKFGNNMSIEDNRMDHLISIPIRNTTFAKSNYNGIRNSVDIINTNSHSSSPQKKLSMSLERNQKEKQMIYQQINNLNAFSNNFMEREQKNDYKNIYNPNASLYERNISVTRELAKSIEDSSRKNTMNFDEDFITTRYLINKYQKKST